MKELTRDRYVMVYNADLCIECNACAVECRRYYGLDEKGSFRVRIQTVETGTFPEVSKEHLRVSCGHCVNAECIKECPTGATFRAEDGFVLITQERCIGCGACVEACPYGARYLRQVGQMLKADKCTWCYARVYEGEKPMCVEKCITGALLFGMASEPAIKKALEAADVGIYHPEYKTNAQLYHKSVRPRRTDVKVLTQLPKPPA